MDGQMPTAMLMSPLFVPVCFTAFVSLRLLLVVFVDVVPHSDAAWYFARAAGLAAGEGYSEDGLPTAYWPVGYPGMLSLLFRLFESRIIVAQMANLAFSSACFVGTYYLARRLTRDEMASRLSILGLTIYPNQISYTALLLSEAFYTCILLWAFIFTIRHWSFTNYVIGGMLFGIASLTKTQTLAFPIFFLLFLLMVYLVDKRKLDSIFLLDILLRFTIIVFAMIVVMGPWVYRNFNTFNAFVLVSTNGGEHLLVGNNPNATGGHLFREEMPDYVRSVPFEQRVARQVERDREAGRIALGWIKENPAEFIMLMPRKVYRLWGPDGEGEWGFQAGHASYDRFWPVFRTLRYMNQVFYAVVLVFSIVATWTVFARKAWSFELLQCLAVPTFITLISMIFTGQSRYHFPAMPFLLILAAAGISQSAFGQRSSAGPAAAG
jgi:Dolichyl-phosphate-mannose-protein mannosyltransferase